MKTIKDEKDSLVAEQVAIGLKSSTSPPTVGQMGTLSRASYLKGESTCDAVAKENYLLEIFGQPVALPSATAVTPSQTEDYYLDWYLLMMSHTPSVVQRPWGQLDGANKIRQSMPMPPKRAPSMKEVVRLQKHDKLSQHTQTSLTPVKYSVPDTDARAMNAFCQSGIKKTPNKVLHDFTCFEGLLTASSIKASRFASNVHTSC
eukprot:6195478-Amphidinium_carterae.2